MTSTLISRFIEHIQNNATPFVEKTINSYRFLTFNVHMWKNYNMKNSYMEIIEVVKESNADVVGLQEAMIFDKKISVRYINDFEKMGYMYHLVCNEKHGINMLFSKYPISNTNKLKLKQDPIQKLVRHAIFADVHFSENNIVKVCVTHLDVYDETELTRLDQIKAIENELKKFPDISIVIMGDFNSLRAKDYTEIEWNQIQTHDFKRNVISQTLVTDYLEEHRFREASDITCVNIKMSVWAMRRVDYIYTLNMNANIICYKTYPTGVSDHYPVYMDIKY